VLYYFIILLVPVMDPSSLPGHYHSYYTFLNMYIIVINLHMKTDHTYRNKCFSKYIELFL